jgi:hypothetical protein
VDRAVPIPDDEDAGRMEEAWEGFSALNETLKLGYIFSSDGHP